MIRGPFSRPNFTQLQSDRRSKSKSRANPSSTIDNHQFKGRVRTKSNSTSDPSRFHKMMIRPSLLHSYRNLLIPVPIAFKNMMTHEFLQIASIIALCCARHRRKTQDIHSLKAVLYSVRVELTTLINIQYQPELIKKRL